MVLTDKLWDDVIAGPQPDKGPDKGPGKLRKLSTKNMEMKDGEGSSKYQRSMVMPGTRSTPTTTASPSTPSSVRENAWRSCFSPGSNFATKKLGAQLFDKPQLYSPTVYDWLYSGETKSIHR